VTNSLDHAIATARSALGVESSLPAQALRVDRVGEVAEDYYLVMFGPSNGTTAIATVGVESGLLQSSAHLPGVRPHLMLSARQAEDVIRQAHPGHDSWSVTAVWKPSSASKSPFYPLWRVASNGEVFYVDQDGKIWTNLDTLRRGG
jgi:hypothetical protein